MVPDAACVIVLRPSAAARRRARREVDNLVGSSLVALTAVHAGDLELIFTVHRDVTRAVGLVLDHALDVEEVA